MEDRERFVELIRALPLVSVDLVLVRDGREVLLGLRNNRPAQGWWFVPGGRILKNEKRADALTRVAARELGIADIHALKPAFLGPFEHFYADCFAGDNGVSRPPSADYRQARDRRPRATEVAPTEGTAQTVRRRVKSAGG